MRKLVIKETRRQATHFMHFTQEQGHVQIKMKLMSLELNGRTTFVFQMLFFWAASRAFKGIFLVDSDFLLQMVLLTLLSQKMTTILRGAAEYLFSQISIHHFEISGTATSHKS